MLGIFEEQVIKTTWTRGFVIGENKDNLINFFRGEGIAKIIKVNVSLNQIFKVELH
jgi:hypothetical protein